MNNTKKSIQFNVEDLPVFFLQMYYLATDIETMINIMTDTINESIKNVNFIKIIDKNQLVDIIKTIELCKSDLSTCKIRLLDQVKVPIDEPISEPINQPRNNKKKDVMPPAEDDKKKVNNGNNNQINNAVDYFAQQFSLIENKHNNEQ